MISGYNLRAVNCYDAQREESGRINGEGANRRSKEELVESNVGVK